MTLNIKDYIKNPFVRAALEAHQKAETKFNPLPKELQDLDEAIDKLIANPGQFTVANIDNAINAVSGWQQSGTATAAAPTCPQLNYLVSSGWARVFELYNIPEEYAHIRDALVVFAIQDGAWEPTQAEVAGLIAYLKTHPWEASITDAYLTTLVAATVVSGQAATKKATQIPAEMFQQADTNPQKIALAEAINKADGIQQNIKHLKAAAPHGIPQQYAHIRDALVVFAIQNEQWAPTADQVTAFNQGLADLGPNAQLADIDRVIQKSFFAAATAAYKTDDNFIQNHPRKDAILEEIKRFAAIKAKIAECTPSSAAASPTTMQLMTALPQEKQEELLAHEGEKLKKLLGAGVYHDIRAAAREAGLTNESFRDAGFKIGDNPLEMMAKEQGTLRWYRTIHNAKIAEILGAAAVDKDGKEICLDKDQIKRLNAFLIAQVNHAQDLFVTELKKAIGLKANQLALVDKLQAQYVAIHAEHQKNKNILNELQKNPAPSIQTRELCQVLARIEKIDKIDDSEITVLQKVINDSSTYDAFKNALESAQGTDPLKTAVDKLKNWQVIITPKNFQYLKQQAIKQKLIAVDPMTRNTEVTHQKALFETLNADLKKFSKANGQILDKLNWLSQLNAVDWLAPEIAGIATRRAQEVRPEFEAIANQCDAICAGLEGMRQQLQTLLDGMPEEPEIVNEGTFSRNHIKSLRKDIVGKLADINKMLGAYRAVHRRIYGDPLRDLDNIDDPNTRLKTYRKGVLTVIQEAAEPAKVGDQPANYNGFQRQELLAKKRTETIKQVLDDYETNAESSNAMLSGNIQANGGLFGDRSQPTPGQEVFYATKALLDSTSNKVVSASGYTETRGTPVTTEVPWGGKQQHQQINLKVTQWPKADPNPQNPEEAKKLLKDAKCRFAIDMAVRLLAGMGTVPTPMNQIVLRGSDPEQVSMIWTALIELGSAHPRYHFDASSIRVESHAFNPKDHKKGILGYGKNSAYKQYFEGNTLLSGVKEQIKAFYEKAFAEMRTGMAQLIRHDTSNLFKKLLQDSKTVEGVDAVIKHKPS